VRGGGQTRAQTLELLLDTSNVLSKVCPCLPAHPWPQAALENCRHAATSCLLVRVPHASRFLQRSAGLLRLPAFCLFPRLEAKHIRAHSVVRGLQVERLLLQLQAPPASIDAAAQSKAGRRRLSHCPAKRHARGLRQRHSRRCTLGPWGRQGAGATGLAANGEARAESQRRAPGSAMGCPRSSGERTRARQRSSRRGAVGSWSASGVNEQAQVLRRQGQSANQGPPPTPLANFSTLPAASSIAAFVSPFVLTPARVQG